MEGLGDSMGGCTLSGSQGDGAHVMLGHLPEDVLLLVIKHLLPRPDDDGFYDSRAVAGLCRTVACCKSWREALKQFLSSLGPRLSCNGSDGELCWLHTIPCLAAAKFTYQEDRQGAQASTAPAGGSTATAGSGSWGQPGGEGREEGLEVRQKDALSALPPGLPELLIDFLDCAVDVGWVPQVLPAAQQGAAAAASSCGRSGMLGLVRLRSPTDCVVDSSALAALLSTASRLCLEAPRVLVIVQGLMGATAGEGGAGAPAARFRSAIELLGSAVAAAAVAAAAGSLAAPGPAASSAAAAPVAHAGPAGSGNGSGSGSGNASRGSSSANVGSSNVSRGGSSPRSWPAAAGQASSARLSITFKDLALLQVSPACTIRVSLLQLLQRAGLERAEWQNAAQGPGAGVGVGAGWVRGVSVHATLEPVPDRAFWYQLDIEVAVQAGMGADAIVVQV